MYADSNVAFSTMLINTTFRPQITELFGISHDNYFYDNFHINKNYNKGNKH